MWYLTALEVEEAEDGKRKAKKAKACYIPNKSSAELHENLPMMVEPTCRLQTDSLRSYYGLEGIASIIE